MYYSAEGHGGDPDPTHCNENLNIVGLRREDTSTLAIVADMYLSVNNTTRIHEVTVLYSTTV